MRVQEFPGFLGELLNALTLVGSSHTVGLVTTLNSVLPEIPVLRFALSGFELGAQSSTAVANWAEKIPGG